MGLGYGARLVAVQRGLHQLGDFAEHLGLAGGRAEHAVERERLLAALRRQPHACAVRAERDRRARVRAQAAEHADLRGAGTHGEGGVAGALRARARLRAVCRQATGAT